MAIRLDLTVSNAADPARRRRVELLVDRAANFAVLPEEVWSDLGLTADEVVEFALPDGLIIERALGHALFDFRGKSRISPVLLGEGDDVAVLGVLTLACLGYELDPAGRELRPLPMLLMRTRLVRAR
jgi:predicted aspartyl protease